MFRSIEQVIGDKDAATIQSAPFLDWADENHVTPEEIGVLIVEAESLYFNATREQRQKRSRAINYLRMLANNYELYLKHKAKADEFRARYAQYWVVCDGEFVRAWDGDQLIDKLELK